MYRYREVESTMEVARELAEEGFTGAVMAERQTRGRGRRGRPWLSPEGGLYLTLVVRPPLPAERLSVLCLAAGAAVAQTLKELYGLSVGLKWPNDILLEERKLGGLLLEASFRKGRPAYVLIGLGLNLNSPVAHREPRAVALCEILGKPVDRDQLLEVLLGRMDEFLRLSPEEIIAAWTAHAETIGKRVRIILPEGELVGLARGVSAEGALILETEKGLREILVGDCVHLRPL